MTTGQWVFIRAHDAWMFRDSKPFSAGQNFYARSLFPPHPGTMQGIMRSHYLETQGIDLAAFGSGSLETPVGTPTSMGPLQLTGPFLARKVNGQIEWLVRTPFDVLREKTSGAFRILAPSRQAQFVTSAIADVDDWRPAVIPNVKQDEQFEDAGQWLTEANLKAYLNGSVDKDGWVQGGELYTNEDRVGLAINYSRRTNEQSRFYRAQFVRPRDDEARDTGLLVHANQTIFKDKHGMMRIGGEARGGVYEQVDYHPFPAAKVTERLKIVMLTPTYFERGGQPASAVWRQWFGKEARLVSMIVGKPLAISGWDMVKRAPKSLRHFVPAGSVYYLEGVSQLPPHVTETPVHEPSYGQMGFGAYAAGSWNYI